MPLSNDWRTPVEQYEPTELERAQFRIKQLEREVAQLRRQVSDYGWEASARHAQATGGTL